MPDIDDRTPEQKERYRVANLPNGDTRVVRVRDGLANVMTGSGTTVDRRSYGQWVMPFMDQYQIEAAYRGSWLMRKVVNLPAFDMTRAWRDWQGSNPQIEALEEEEKRLNVREKVRLAKIMGRLGGGAILMGINQGEPGDVVIWDQIAKGDLRYLHVVSRYALNIGPIVGDPDDPDFGTPEYFELRRTGQQPLKIHRDRVLVFKGEFAGAGSATSVERADFWGDSVVAAVDEPVRNAETAMNEFASIIHEAKIDVFGIPDLLNNVGTPEYEARLIRRLELANLGKSTHRALVKDAAETWEQRQVSWAGMPEVIRTYLSVVAGASDIPATRLLGKSADGMNATGEGDQSNYDQMISSLQTNELRPLLEKMDQALIPSSAPGGKVEDIYFEFAPLNLPSEQQMAETEAKEAETLSKLVATALFEDTALEEAFSNRMIESGRWPGYEDARKKALAAAAEEPTPEDIAGTGIANDPATGTGQPGTGVVPPRRTVPPRVPPTPVG
jgi:phage-related protein (TIGR01555 family)